MKLAVFRNNLKLGTLDIQASESFFGFAYDNDYLSTPEAYPLSLSLPLTNIRYTSNQAQPYFEGLLPEGEARDAISRRLGISRTSSTKLLHALGRDCAGDISIIDEDENQSPDTLIANNKNHTYDLLENGLTAIAQSPRIEIPRLQENTRLSLAGGQEKIALYHKNGSAIEEDWYIPTHGAPSTHIIKPGLLEAHYPFITLNEFLCLRAASACNIHTVNVDIRYPGTPVLIIQRYDRKISSQDVNGFNVITRAHQEDLCQANGIISDLKYEHDGGPGYKQIRDMLARYARKPFEDIEMLVKWGLFNYMIGNCDAHAKNLSLLHNSDGTVSIAPVYDLISTSVYDGIFGSKLSRGMGMRIGQHENIDKINEADIRIFADNVRVRLSQVKLIGSEIISSIPSAFDAAVYEADKNGFSNADEMACRIIKECENRAKIILSA